MAKNSNIESRTPRPVIAAFVVGILLAFGALILTNARTASAAFEEAEGLHAADMTIAAQDVALKSVGQLVLLAQDFELGVASQETLDAAAAEANRAMAAFDSQSATFEPSVADSLSASIVGFRTAANGTIDLAVAGDVNGAAGQFTDLVVPTAETLAAEVTIERDLRAQAIEDAQGRAGRYAQIAAFLTAFLLPFGAIVIYRRSVRRQLETAEGQLDARLEAEKTVGRAKDQFIATVSSELRTPLASIYEFSETLLEQGLVDPGAAGDLVELINTESGELSWVVEDLLVAAHDEDVPLPSDLAECQIAEEIDAVIKPCSRDGVIVGGTYAEAAVVGDRLRIRQIVRNLLSNAVKHGGPTIRVYGDAAGSRYAVAIEDDGAGVPEGMEDRLFTPLAHQGEAPSGSGSVGLGLAVARLLAEAMGGSLDYEHITGRTSFVLTLPLAESEPEVVPSEDLLAATAG